MSLIRAVAATRARLSSAAAGSIIRLSRPVASVGSSSPVSSVCAAVRRPLSMRSGPATPHSQPPPADTTPYTTREDGAFGSNAWRMHLNANGKDLSFWHDIPLLAPGSSHTQLLFHYVNEIPKGTRPKMEIATKEPGNPIKQDVKKGNLRRFTYGDLPFNYGAIPQTWENPHETHPLTKLAGDNDPIDVVELSKEPIQMGAVRAVKVVGVIALLDEGETDWKILAIDSTNPLADSVKTIEDIETHFPGQINTVREWLRNYKTTDGKPQNQFAFDEKVMDVGMAQKVIWETHAAWAALCRGEIPANELVIPAVVPKAAKGE